MAFAVVVGWTDLAAAQPALRPSQQTALANVDQQTELLKRINKEIWEFAEVGLEEKRSSAVLIEALRKDGFQIETGLGGMPTAFVATFGSGKPVIALLAEYDALPALSQKVSPEEEPVEAGRPGHGCGHSGLGAGSLGAALAVKKAMQQHKLPGTIKLYGTPAEETTIGKVYMLLDGAFQDVDVCLHWHPSTKNQVWNGSSKAIVSAKFTFRGVAAHASGNPEQGRSALDAVELMNIGVNFMREHVKDDARLHYVITDGGGAPNVVPATATVWYYVRADDHKDVEEYFPWVQDIARGAAMMTRTKLSVAIDTDCHELIPNTPLAELIQANFAKLTPPKFTPDEQAFARRLQEPLVRDFGLSFPVAIDESIHPLDGAPEKSKGSTDVGDISWHVPTCGLRTACMASGSPGHCWQNVAAIGSTIGEKGLVYAARIMAITTLDLLEKPELVTAAKQDFDKRMKDRKYISLIPKGQKPPEKIR
jgi:aminobenzoyl-glutamate utilization protein B